MAGISDNDKFLRALHVLGGSAGNKAMIDELEWSEEKYARIRHRLVLAGTIAVGTGRGGSVHLSQQIKYRKETDLYEPLRNSMQNNWDEGWNADQLTVEVTARGGSRRMGRYSRPDLCAVSLRTYKFLSQKHIDLWTFEVKPLRDMRVDHVMEAVAHSRFAHKTYIMFHIENDSVFRENSFARCLAEAERHGIGFVTFKNPNKYSEWNWHREAERKNPNPEHLNEFIGELPASIQDQVLKWHK